MNSLRIAAIADLHVRTRDDLSRLSEALAGIEQDADVLLLAGDLTETGLLAEIQTLSHVLAMVNLPMFAVFGNHDRRGMRRRALARALREVGVTLLDASGAIITMPGGFRVGIAGVIGTGGGFKAGEQFGPGARFTQAALVKARREAARLRKVLKELEAQRPNQLIVMTHFSPTVTTLGDEPPMKYWMLGNALLGSTIDDFKPSLAIHGHSHLGSETGSTPGGTPIYNVALPVTQGIVLLELFEDGRLGAIGKRELPSPADAGSVRESDVV